MRPTDPLKGSCTPRRFFSTIIKREIGRSGQNGNQKRGSPKKKGTLKVIFNQNRSLISSPGNGIYSILLLERRFQNEISNFDWKMGTIGKGGKSSLTELEQKSIFLEDFSSSEFQRTLFFPPAIE